MDQMENISPDDIINLNLGALENITETWLLKLSGLAQLKFRSADCPFKTMIQYNWPTKKGFQAAWAQCDNEKTCQILSLRMRNLLIQKIKRKVPDCHCFCTFLNVPIICIKLSTMNVSSSTISDYDSLFTFLLSNSISKQRCVQAFKYQFQKCLISKHKLQMSKHTQHMVSSLLLYSLLHLITTIFIREYFTLGGVCGF